MSELLRMLDGWFSHWHLGLIASTLCASLIQLMLTHTKPHAHRMLRNNLLFGGLCLLMSLLVHPLVLAGMKQSASVLEELSTLGLGLLLIRICGLTAFRVLLPALRFNPPAILEDILLVLTYIAWGMVRLRAAGLDLTGLVTTSAVITAVIAFSMQETLGNILGGLALQLDNSVRIGDWISIDGVRGQVVEVHWRHTDVQTTNGHLIVIPNGMLMKSKVDVYSRLDRPPFRRWIKFWVSDMVPPQDVINTVTKALREAQIERVALEPPPECIVTDYNHGAIEYAVRYWLLDARHDDGTDSVVRVHFYAALKRQNYVLAHPVMNVSLVHDGSKLNASQREQELARRKHALRRTSLFAALSDDEIAHVASSLRNTPFIKDDVMTKQGAVAHWLYLLVEGEADVWYEANGQRSHLALLKPGDVFGEMGLLTGEPRSATVTAHSDTLCYRLDKELFEQILHQRPELASEFAHILTQRSRELNALKQGSAPVQHVEHATYLDSIRRFFGLGGH
ncbi:MAG: hypothetical protein RL748_390 [Pseudomonadota bacterium]|jgi:small-conductance mechanosensitive channel/CRP-like cAMP-binding protein